MAFKFEQLKVWESALKLSGEVADLVKQFPKDEMYVLTPQIRRATDSISLNIAEGSTGQSNPEFRKFLRYAIRSAIEVVGCLFLARQRKIVDDKIFRDYYDKLTVLIKGIQALKNSLK